MGLFSFGGSKSKSSSNSNSRTFVDPNQAPYRQDLMRQASQLNAEGMPVEGVAGINPRLGSALGQANRLGNMQARGGANLMANGAGQTRGTGMALNYANQAMGGNALGGIGTAIGTGLNYAGRTASANAALGGGVNSGMANNMATSASLMNSAQNMGANLNQARGIGGLAASSGAAQNAGFNQNNLGNYINNDVLQGQINASTRDIFRDLNENQMTGIASQAAGTGNSGSSRAGVMAGIAQRGANDRAADVSAQMRGQAYNTALGIEANRANQNASMQQQTNLANQNALNSMMSQGVGVAAQTASENAGFNQAANQTNAAAQNQLRGQGYQIGANQIDSNLNRQQQTNLSNQGAYNSALATGANLGAGQYNTNLQNQQFGASMAQDIGRQGVSNMMQGQAMANTGVGLSQGSGQYLRDYEQQLLNNQYQRQMSPFNSLNFYNQIVGAPNNLSNASASSKGSSKSISMGFGGG
jgi:hypothetical protein